MEVNIHFKGGSNLVDIEIYEDDGSKVEKTITVCNYEDIFKGQEKKKYYCMASIFDDYEEAGTVKGLLYGENQNGQIKGLFFVPADQRYMNVAGEKSIMPYPSLVFRLHARNGILISSKCFAVTESDINRLKMNSRLYAFPFGNVMPEDAHICWGSNQFAEIYEFEELRSVITTFFCSESNMDYVRPGSSYAGRYGSYTKFLGELKKLKKFPSKALVPSTCIYTIGDLIASMQ